MAKWSDFAPLHFLTELGCEMLADNGFVAYIKQQKKNPSFWMEYLHIKRHKIKFKWDIFGQFQTLSTTLSWNWTFL